MKQKRKSYLKKTGRQLFHRFEQDRWYQVAHDYLGDRTKMHTLLGMVAHLFHNRALAPVLKDLVMLYYYVSDIVKGNYKGYNSYKLVMVVALLLYVVTPIDLIPDWLPGAGFLDDAALLGYSMKLLDRELQKYLQWVRLQKEQATHPDNC